MRESGATPATIALLDGVVRDRPRRRGARRDRHPRRRRQVQRPRPADRRRARRHRRDDGRRHRPPRRPGRDRAVRDRRARRRAPRGARDLGRVGRPLRALAHGICVVCAGRQVDPRRARHARAARDARRRRRRLRHRPLPRLLPHRLRPPGDVAHRHAGEGRRRAARPRRARPRQHARDRQPAARRRAARPRPARARARRRRSRPPSEERIRGRDVTPFLLARFHADTGGESLRANVRLVLRNAQLAARIAVALAT